MSGISRRDLNDLGKSARHASDSLDALSPKSAALADRLTDLDAKLGELSIGRSVEDRLSAPPPGIRGYASLNRWAPVVNFVAAAATVCAIVPAVLSLQAAQRSLTAAEAALQRDQISQSFSSHVSACVSATTDPVAAEVSGTTLSTVVTNTGRLPITILDVKSGAEEGSSPIDFSWLPLNANDTTPSSDPIYLAVGEAVAMTVFIPGSSFDPTLRFALSNGLPDQEVALNESPNDAEFPRTVSDAFEVLPDFCG